MNRRIKLLAAKLVFKVAWTSWTHKKPLRGSIDVSGTSVCIQALGESKLSNSMTEGSTCPADDLSQRMARMIRFQIDRLVAELGLHLQSRGPGARSKRSN